MSSTRSVEDLCIQPSFQRRLGHCTVLRQSCRHGNVDVVQRRRPSLRGSLHNRSEVPRDADWDTTYLKRIRLHGNLLILGGELVTSLGGISGSRSIIITVAENYHVSQSLWVCIVPGIRNAE